MRDELVAPVGIINRCCTCLIANLACFIVFVTKSLLAHMSTKCHLLLGQLKIRGLRRSATNLWIAILDPFFCKSRGCGGNCNVWISTALQIGRMSTKTGKMVVFSAASMCANTWLMKINYPGD